MPGITRWLRRTEIKAIRPEHLDEALRRAGLLQLLEAGDLRCSRCGETVGRENIGCIVKRSGSLEVRCSNLACCSMACGESGVQNG